MAPPKRIGREDGEEYFSPGRVVRVDQMVTSRTIARRLGYRHVQAIQNLRSRDPDFPGPLARFGPALVWYVPDVRRWATVTGHYFAE